MMLKKTVLVCLLFLLPLVLLGCSDNSELPNSQDPPSQNGQNNEDPPTQEEPSGEEPNTEEPSNLEDLLPVDTNGTRVLMDSIESREVKEHVITSDTVGVYEIYSGANFDASGVLFTSEKEHIKGDYRANGFIITLF